MNQPSEKEWLKDFQDFVSIEAISAPEHVSNSILSRVHEDLNPSSWLVFGKLLSVHGVVGTLSLAICSQFGLNPFHSGFSLSDYFMTFGHSACMAFCGVLFVGLSILVGRAILRMEEFRMLKKHALLQVFGLSALSIGVFAAVGAEIALSIGVLWFVGAMASGIVLTRLLHTSGRLVQTT